MAWAATSPSKLFLTEQGYSYEIMDESAVAARPSPSAQAS